MSYDLYFSPRDNSLLTPEAFAAYFGSKPRYTVENDCAGYALWFSPISFRFSVHAPKDKAGRQQACHASFSMPVGRPHYFPLEAWPHIEAFAEAFDLAVEDPQCGTPSQGELDRETFFRGWKQANLAACALALTLNPQMDPYTLPAQELEGYWRWNHTLSGPYTWELPLSGFAPHVMFFEHEGRAKSMVVWADSIPILIPPVDLIAIVKTGSDRREMSSSGVFPRSEYEKVTSQFPLRNGPLPYREIDYKKPPSWIKSWCRKPPIHHDELKWVNPHEILAQETIDEAKKVELHFGEPPTEE